MGNTEKQSLFSLGKTLSTKHGRQTLWELISYCGIYQDIAGDPNAVFKRLGQRSVGLHLLAQIENLENGDKLFILMSQEAKERSLVEEKEYDDTSSSTSSTEYERILGTDTNSDYAHLPKHDSGASPVF